MHDRNSIEWAELAARIREWGHALGFTGIGIARAEVGEAANHLWQWLAQGRHGTMDYMARHASLRAAPAELLPGTISVISARLGYWPEAADAATVLADPDLAYVSRYALGRDYHKTIRSRLQRLAERITEEIGPFTHRAFSDSAPVMEVEFARQSGHAWRGKHTLSLTRGGSWHFLGELYTDLPLPADASGTDHCGTCNACLQHCPTKAIVAPYEVDARRCISYLTIELDGPIPEELRPLMGNRIYGCDDCQLCCPWNRFATAGDADFLPRHRLDAATLLDLFSWSESEFNERLAGNPIRRIGHARWLRNIATALGNALGTAHNPGPIRTALQAHAQHPAAMVREHVVWALARGGTVIPPGGATNGA